jgi:DNA polymerase III delta' subunit
MIIGHQPIVKYLKNIIKRDNPAHAYLFCGPSNIGKTTTAKWFVQGLVCESSKNRPCNQCKNCLLMRRHAYPDFYFVKAKKNSKNISINQIRDLRTQITKTPFYNSYKVAIIEGTENLNNESANAFLKILEEPPGQTVFVLITNDIKAILPTISSRTEIIKFSLVPEEAIINALNNNYTLEQKKFIARFACGRIGHALKLDGVEIKNIVAQEKTILQIIKSCSDQKIIFIENLVKNNSENLVRYTASLIRDLMLCKIGLVANITHRYLQKELYNISAKQSLTAVKDALEILIQCQKFFKQNVNQQLLWQNLFLKI